MTHAISPTTPSTPSKLAVDSNVSTVVLALKQRLHSRATLTPCKNLFMLRVTCVKWGSVLSRSFKLTRGIRQSGVLSPHLFALYIDSVVDRVKANGLGCYYKLTCVSILLYTDDILLLAPSITALQQLVFVCESELSWLDMTFNIWKSACTRIGLLYMYVLT